MKTFIIIALTLASVGCLAQNENCEPGSATVHMFRDKRYVASRVSPRVWADSMELAKISNGSYFQACLPAGVHRFKVDNDPYGSLELKLDPSSAYFLQVQLAPSTWKAHWEIVTKDEPMATAIMLSIFPLETNKIKARDYVLARTLIRKDPENAAYVKGPNWITLGAAAEDIKGVLIQHMRSWGYTIDNESTHQISFWKEASGRDAFVMTLFHGNAYSENPKKHIQFTFTPDSAGMTKVEANGSITIKNAFGKEDRRDTTNYDAFLRDVNAEYTALGMWAQKQKESAKP